MTGLNIETVALKKLEVFTFRAPIVTPVITSFGSMVDRPAVFLRITDTEGNVGWGEIFANWPASGAEHRARLLIEDVSDLLIGYKFTSLADVFEYLTQATHIRALQCGEWGTFRQVVAGIDLAIYDLVARRQNKPLRILLSASAPNRVAAYASGIHINQAQELIKKARVMGFIRFKVKIGFNMEEDIAKLRTIYASLQDNEYLLVDANQAWTLEQAIEFSNKTQDIPFVWIEEPIRADLPKSKWQKIYDGFKHPIAAGENIAGYEDFKSAIDDNILSFIQPDLAKWGGFTGCVKVARDVMSAGKTYHPHFLGGIVGLIASAHYLAGVGGNGFLEIDVNENPLRDVWGDLGQYIDNGDYLLPEGAGLGIQDPLTNIEQYQSYTATKLLL